MHNLPQSALSAIASIGAVASAISAALVLADWIMADDQKSQFSTRLIGFWLWLDHLQKMRFVDAFLKGRIQIGLAGITVIIYFICTALVWLDDDDSDLGDLKYLIPVLITGSLLYSCAARILPRRLARDIDHKSYLRRLYTIGIVYVLIWMVAVAPVLFDDQRVKYIIDDILERFGNIGLMTFISIAAARGLSLICLDAISFDHRRTCFR